MKNLREDRYRCLVCCDEGSVSVWHSHVIESLQEGREPKSWDTAFARCTCPRGQSYATRDPRAVTYNPDVHCICGVWIWRDGEYVFPTVEEERAAAREFANRRPVAVEFNPDHWQDRD